MQSVPITTNIVSLFLILLRQSVLDATLCDKVVTNLRQVSGFLQVLRFPPPIKLTSINPKPPLSMIYMYEINITDIQMY
jgi:hypothetical protein